MGSYNPTDKKTDSRNPAWNSKLQSATDAVAAGAAVGKSGTKA